MKICNHCNKKKEYKEYNKNKNTKDNYSNTCRLCIKNINMNSYQNNKEIYNKKAQNHYQNNKEIYIQKALVRQKLNPEKAKEYMTKYINKIGIENYRKLCYKSINKKYKNDINFKLRCNLSSRLLETLKKQKTYKSNSILKLIGCSIKELKKHIENQFKPEMNWENHGEVWEIDHIKPCSVFDLTQEEEQRKCFNYNNLQPLFKTTKIAENLGYINEIGNRNKSSKILYFPIS